MAFDPETVRKRAFVEHRRPPIHDVDDPLWVAEDPVTDCAGVGRVEAEAIGNLVAVVAAFEDDDSHHPRLKLPGRVVARPAFEDDSSTLLERIRSVL